MELVDANPGNYVTVSGGAKLEPVTSIINLNA